jgi:diguanylate cyclase (GGDEF)-like protein
MNVSVLKDIDFASYRELLGALLPEHFRFAANLVDGETFWRDADFPVSIPRELLRQLCVEAEAAQAQRLNEPLRLDGASTFVAPITIDGDKPIAFLWAATREEAFDKRSMKWLTTVADQISKEIGLHSELESFANELAERYEELNLVYHTEDHVNYFKEGQDALEQLVRNCCDYLDVGLVVLVLKEKDVTVVQQSLSESIVEAQLAVDRIRDGIYDVVVDSAEAIVINEPNSMDASSAWKGMPYRLLAAPVEDGKGHASGLLAIVNPLSRPKYSNSDRNLVEVMARKATKILQVSYDTLTGLLNREGLEFHTEQALQESRSRDVTHCVLHIDIDQLHVINDTVSHGAGNAVLQAIAAQFRQSTRDTDVVARVGGDEIAILLRQCPLERGTEIADKLRESIVDLIVPWEDKSLKTTVSIGVAPVSAETQTASAALAAAELACDAAKELGKNRVQRFSAGDTGLVRRHHEMEAVGRIQDALKLNRFVLYGQPIRALAKRASGDHVEVLLRMADEDGQIVPPGEFLPAAERYHLMPEIDRWVIGTLFGFLDEHVDSITGRLSLISVNISGQSLNEPGFCDWLIGRLVELRTPHKLICFEITETTAVENLDEANAFMRRVREYGCQFALDDFGSGLSSFGYLRALPVDYLKIDGAIVREIAEDDVAASMVAAVCQVANVMQLQTIAEFVENDAIRDKLVMIGVDYGQGYGLGKPAPLQQQLNLSKGLAAVASR